MYTPEEIFKLREKIKRRTEKLDIKTAHTNIEHFYKKGEQIYPSVSSYLKFVKDPSLSNYSLNQMGRYIESKYKEFTPDNIEYHIRQAKNASTEAMEQAGDIGTAVHKIREDWFQTHIDKTPRTIELSYTDMPLPGKKVDSRIISCLRGMHTLVSKYKLIPIATEISLVDHKLKIGGQLDDIMLVNGDTLALVDVKTSNKGDKTAYYYQVALYYRMFWNLYKIKIDKVYIAHLSKENGEAKLIEIPDMKQLLKETMYLIKLKESYNRIENSKIKQSIKI